MKDVLFSVIVPLYNAENFLKNNLQSIFFDRQELQYIFINDGSTDRSEEILTEFCENHSNSEFYTIEHKGVSAARNYGIEQAVGKYIMFCDIDDGYAPKTFDVLRNYIFSDFDIIIFGAKINNLSNNFHLNDIETRDYDISYPQIMDAFYTEKGTWPYVWNCCYKRNFIINNNLRFKCSLELGEDLVFQFESFIAAEDIKFISNQLYIYNYCTDSSSISYYLNNPTERIKKHLILVKEIDSLYSVNNLERNPKYSEWVINFLFYDITALNSKDYKKLKRQYCLVLNTILNNKTVKGVKNRIKLLILKNSIFLLMYKLYKKLIIKS